MPRIVIKEEAKEEKKEKSGAWERKKVTHAPNLDKRGSKTREKERKGSFSIHLPVISDLLLKNGLHFRLILYNYNQSGGEGIEAANGSRSGSRGRACIVLPGDHTGYHEAAADSCKSSRQGRTDYSV